MTAPVRILRHPRVFTGLEQRPWTDALAIVGGRVIALGHQALAWREAPGAVVEQVEGALVIPGIIDAHIHLMWYAKGLRELDLRDCTRQDMLQRVAERAAELAPGTWITGRGWDQNLWERADFPTAAELDAVAPEHPVALDAKSGHALIANTLALRAAGITSQTPDPPHGVIVRDSRGCPTGLLLEEAIGLVSRAKPEPSFATLIDLFDEAQGRLLSQGITAVHDVDGHPSFAVLQELHRQGRQRVRVVKYVRLEALDGVIQAGLRSGFGDDRLRFGGLKLFSDGALGSRTAALFDPYLTEPENRGILTLAPDSLREIARRAASHGIALAIHAIGDYANHVVLDALEDVQALAPHLRHRIEHVQLIRPEDQARLARGGFVASMQPTHAIHDMDMAERYWGERCSWAYAWRSLQEAGVPLAFGSDAPIEVFDPFLGLYAAITRRSEINGAPGPAGWYPQQRLTLTEALRAYTYGGAYAAGQADRLGCLAPGYYADLVVLDQDMFSLPPDALLETHVRRVMIEGTWQDLPKVKG